MEESIHIIIRLLLVGVDDSIGFPHIDKEKLHKLVLTESDKAYMSRHVTEDNKQQLFSLTKICVQELQHSSRRNNLAINIPAAWLLPCWKCHICCLFSRGVCHY